MKRLLSWLRGHPATTCALVAALVRVAYVATADGPAFTDPIVDAAAYDHIARALMRGAGFPPGPFYQPPLEPLVVGLLFRLFGYTLLAPRILQISLGALTAGLAADLARRLVPTRAAPFVGGLGVALAGPLVFYDAELLPTSFATFFLTL